MTTQSFFKNHTHDKKTNELKSILRIIIVIDDREKAECPISQAPTKYTHTHIPQKDYIGMYKSKEKAEI